MQENESLEQQQNKICPNCGVILEDDLKFCRSCGTKIENTLKQSTPPGDNQEVQKDDSADILCPSCGEEVKQGLIFCTSCGIKVSIAKNFRRNARIVSPQQAPPRTNCGTI